MEQQAADELLCDCLGREINNISTARLQQLSASDWEDFIQRSVRHDVTPLLYQRLKPLFPNINIPINLAQRLREVYLQSAARNIRFAYYLAKVLKVFQEDGIPVIVLKGIHLAEIIYNNPALRPMCDVDLLFKKEDLARSQKKLTELGYSPFNSSLPIDVHWNVDLSSTNLDIDIKDLWKRAQPVIIAGVEVLALAPEDLLLHLCSHLSFHHLFESNALKTLCDVKEIVSYYKSQLHWEQVLNRARAWGIWNALWLTLALANDLIAAEIPAHVLEDLNQAELDPQVRAWAIEQIFNSQATRSDLSLSPYFWELWGTGSLKHKIVSLRKLLLPAPEFVSQQYPASFGSVRNYLYYLVRLKNHFLLYIQALWRILMRDADMTSLVKRQNRNSAMREWLLARY